MRVIRVSLKYGDSWLYLMNDRGKIIDAANEIRDAERIHAWAKDMQINPIRHVLRDRVGCTMHQYAL